jgi:hypothetical protein
MSVGVAGYGEDVGVFARREPALASSTLQVVAACEAADRSAARLLDSQARGVQRRQDGTRPA